MATQNQQLEAQLEKRWHHEVAELDAFRPADAEAAKRLVYTGFKSAPFREISDDEPSAAFYQQIVNRCEERVRKNQRPEAAPLLAARQAERLQFAETTADIEPNDDDDLWQQPDKASPIALVVCCASALLMIAAFSVAFTQMVRG